MIEQLRKQLREKFPQAHVAPPIAEEEAAPEQPFDPASFTPEACSRLVWVRCGTATEMLKATDLLVRDANIPFVLLDTCGIGRRELSGIPASAWWRLKLAAGAGNCRLVVMSPVAQVPCAAVRVALNGRLGLEDFELPRRDLVSRLRAVPERVKRVN